MQNTLLQRSIIYTIAYLAIGYMINGCWGSKQAEHKRKNIKRHTKTIKLTQKKVPKGTDDQDISSIHAIHKDTDDQKDITYLEEEDDDEEEEDDEEDDGEEEKGNHPYNLLTKHQLNVPKSLRSAIKGCKYCSQGHNDAWDEATINELLAKRSSRDIFLLSRSIIVYKQKKFFSEKHDQTELQKQVAQYEKEVEKRQQQQKEIAEDPALCKNHKQKCLRYINRKKQLARHKFQDVQQTLKNSSYPRQQYTSLNQSGDIHHTNFAQHPPTSGVPRLYPPLPQ